MKADQVGKALRQKFLEDDERIVFWNDPDGEFKDYVSQGLPDELSEVTLRDVGVVGGLSTKLLLEREDPIGKYLLYSSQERPDVDEDWLLDVRLYSAEFHADVASLWLEELGIEGLSLRDHLKGRALFLGSQARRTKLGRLVDGDDDEATLDLKMMAVLVGSEVANLFSILQALCHGHLVDGQYDLVEQPRAVEQFEKMGFAESFWSLVKKEFGYEHDSRSVSRLLRSLFVSEFLHQVGEGDTAAIQHFSLPVMGSRQAVVCLTQWRDSRGKAKSYDAVANAIEAELGLMDQFRGFSLEALSEAFSFWGIERAVISGLKRRVLEEAQAIKLDEIVSVVSSRKSGHWLSGPDRGLPERRAVADAYDAIVAAAELFALDARHQNQMAFDSPEALLVAYRDELFRFDQLYRRFCTKAKAAQGQGWDLLKTLAAEVEDVYEQGFLAPLGLEWGRLLDAGFLGDWQSKQLPAQQAFYADNIKPHLKGSERKRAYVIVSDAFRYEAAQQLTEVMKGRFRMDAELGAMLGVLPSYTTLGMASLLPHETLEYTDKGDVLVDGKSTSSTDARNKQLARVQGMACLAKDLIGMKKGPAREFIQGARVVYIYHNVIDARGDTASTELETFQAVEECVEELAELAKFCINTLNAGTVWITADHGFLYQQDAPNETTKSELAHKPADAVKMKKRYVLGRNLGGVQGAHCGSTSKTAGTSDAMGFWVPRGTGKFHFVGGARFVHGGAMPQEVVVPLVTVTHLRGSKAANSKSEKVSVQVLGTKHKITTPKYRFEVIQTEPVGERRLPITLRAAVYEGTLAVTSVATVTFDSSSDSMEERKQDLRVELSAGEYDKTKPYRLVLRDAETDAEVQSIPVVIDRSFDDDF